MNTRLLSTKYLLPWKRTSPSRISQAYANVFWF